MDDTKREPAMFLLHCRETRPEGLEIGMDERKAVLTIPMGNAPFPVCVGRSDAAL